jgi:hypothetical protein
MKQPYYTVRLGTKRLPPAELVERGRLHVSMLTGNPQFPDPNNLIPQLAEACDVLDRSSQLATFNRGRYDIITRNSDYARVTFLIRQVGGLVSANAGGSVELITSTGFEVKTKRQPSQPLPAPARVVAKRTPFPGCIELRWSAVRNRRLYEVQIQDPARPDGWKPLAQISRNHLTIEHLQSNVVHTFRVVAIGALGASPVSGIATAKAA